MSGGSDGRTTESRMNLVQMSGIEFMLHAPPTLTAGLVTSLKPVAAWDPSPVVPDQSWRVELKHPLELEEQDLAAWRDLLRMTACENPFLAPEFVLPACRNLETASPILLSVQQEDRWCGVGLFEAVGPQYRLPVPHLRTWRTPYTFLQGMLLRRGQEAETLAAFWDYMQSGGHSWHAVEFTALAHDTPEFHWLHQSAVQAGVESLTRHVHTRAFLQQKEHRDSRDVDNLQHVAGEAESAGTMQKMTAQELATMPLRQIQAGEVGLAHDQCLTGESSRLVNRGISRRRARSLRQSRNWLQRQGGLELRFQRDPETIAQSIDRFLQLEALGWKGETATALSSRAADERFFREMAQAFLAQGQLMFVELLVGGEVMGSVVHLQQGRSSYAFKLGWNPRLARGGPGFQMKAFTEREIFVAFPELERVDSCACPGSFIEHVWPDRRTCSSNLFMTSRAGVIAGSVVGALRWIRDYGRRLLPWRADPLVAVLPVETELPEHCEAAEQGT